MKNAELSYGVNQTQIVSTCDLFTPSAGSPGASNENSRIALDENAEDSLLDDTEEVEDTTKAIPPPEGFHFESRPNELPPISSWI